MSWSQTTSRFATILSLVILPLASLYGQEDEMAIPWSQKGGVTQRLAWTDISITYNRPVARGRDLFGNIVKWGRIWNPGADSATTVTFSTNVTIEGQMLAAGRYTVWMIPQESGPWPVMFSNKVDIYHTPYPGEAHDALRLEVVPSMASHMETLAWYFAVADRERGELRMHWGETVVALEIVAPAED